MFCPNLSDPNIKAQFESLQSIVPEYAYYLWDKYQGEVPAKYYNLSNVLIDLPELNSSAVSSEGSTNILSNNSLFGIDIQNPQQLEFHVNTLNVVTQFLENIGVEQRLVPEFLSEQGSVVEGAIAAANFINGTVDIIDDLNKRPEAWNKLPEEAAHFWYRLLDSNSPLKDALLTASLTDRKEEELRNSLYGSVYNGPKVLGKLALDDDGNVTSKPALSAIREEAIGQLIAEAIKRIENKNANTADYSFFKKFLEWVNSVIKSFKNTTIDPFEVAAMKILSSDMSDLMTWAEYSKLNNIVNFADVLTEQSVAPIDYTLIDDIGVAIDNLMYVEDDTFVFKYGFIFRGDYKQKYGESSPKFSTQQELDNWVSANVPEHDERQKAIIQEVRDNQAFFDRLLNKSFKKRSKFLPKTLRKYFNIVDSDNLYRLEPWNVSQELGKITKKLSDEEKEQLVRTNGYTNIAPTLKVLPDLLQKYKKNPIVLSETIKLDGAKKQELSILDGIRKMIKSENPNLKSITAEDFVQQVHEWLNFHYLLGFADENSYLSYRVDQTFTNVKDRSSDEDFELANMTEAEIQALPFAERQRIATILGLTKQNPDVYHNKVSLRFNDKYHLKSGHFNKSPSAWGNLTYFYTGKNKWKDRVLLHEIQNDNIEFLREYKSEKVNLETSLGRYLQDLNETLLANIAQIESPNARVVTHFSGEFSTYKSLNTLLDSLKGIRTDSQLTTFKQRIAESIELYRSDDSLYNKPEKAQELVNGAYAAKRKFVEFKKRGGIKSLLTESELEELRLMVRGLNENIETNEWEYNALNLAEKKEIFKSMTMLLREKINDRFRKLYGDNSPLITLSVPAKRLPKTQRHLRGTNEEKLNESVDSLLAFSEIQMDKYLSRAINDTKRIYSMARNANTAYEFNLGLSKITPDQFNTLIENFKYNQDLLIQAVKEQSQKDLSSSQTAETKKAKSIIQYLEQNFDGKLGEFTVRYLNNNVYVTSIVKGLSGLVSSDMWDIQKFLDYVKQVNPSLLDIDTSFLLFTDQQNTFTALKQKALDKKEELEKDYGKVEEEVKQTLDVEMNYFTPLVHHLIQKHINQYGKDFPMYFSGFEITKLTQNNDRTALIYAGKDEINIVDKNIFDFNNSKFEIKDISEIGQVELGYFKDKNKISQQEYEKAYQQATERRAKEIKFEAALNIGILDSNEEGINSGKDIKKLSDKELEQGIKKLNDFKKQSKQNLDRVVNTIMNISNSKPIETGAIYNAMTQVSGVKLIWENKVEGLKGEPGGYKVDLSNYNYNTPVLYGLQTPQSVVSTDIKEGVPELFESNPELANIGTPQQYSQYLDSIFPESKVKLPSTGETMIVYHGSNQKFDKFDKQFFGKETPEYLKSKGFWFTHSKEEAENYGKVTSVLLNMKNPYVKQLSPTQPKFANQITDVNYAIKNNFDSAILDIDEGIERSQGVTEYVVFEPEQIHILGNKQDIEEFKKFIATSTMPTTMFSRKDAKFVSNRFIRLERQYDFLKESQMDSEYWKLPSIAAKKQYLAKKQFDTVVKLVEGRNSVQVVNNKIYLSPTKAVQGGKVLYGYATGLAEDINKMYPLVTDSSPAYVREDFNGRIYVEFDLTGRYATLLVEGVEFLEEETMRAEIELMDIQDAIRKEKAAIMEKLESANEVVIDGEVYAYTGSMFQKSFGLTQALKDPKIKDYTKVLNKLVSKFPGVTWKWNTDIVEVAKVNLATGQIEINPNLIQEDTPWHEFGHFVVRGIRESNPELFEQLKKEIEALHNEAPTSSSYSRVEASYPEYIGTDSFWEEAIVTELGRQAAKKENRSLFDKIFDWFQGLLKGFNKGVSQTSNMSNLVDSLVDSSVTFDTDFNEEAVSDYMFQRIVPAEEVDALTSYVKISPNDPFVFKDYAEKVQVIANAISETEFKKILDTNKYLGLGSESLQRALAAIKEVKNIVTKEDVAASVLELADYLQYSALYLTGVVRHLNNIIEDPNIPSGKKLGDLHRGYKQALAIEKHIKKIEDLFTTRALDEMMRSEVQKDAFLKNLSWMRTAIATIKNGHNNKIIDPVIDELAETFKAQSKDIEASFDRDIDKLKTRTQTDTIIKRIKELELEKQNSLLTPENIKKFLADTNSPWYLAIDSAMATKNPGVQLIANYIRSINNEFQENLKPIASEWQDLMDDIAASEGGFVGSALQTKKFFEPFIRETVLYEVIDGELVKDKKVLSLNTEVKTVELGNRITELKHAIDFGATEEIREQAEEDLKKFYEEYTERPFTDDYYEIQKLLPDDIKFKRNQIYQELAAIREEFGTGIIEDEILERLRDKEQELYELERLYTEDGTLKEGKPLEDALAIQAWKEGKRSADVVSFVLTPDSKAVFERMLVDKKAQLAKSLAAAKTTQQRDDAHKAYNNWASIYTRTVYTQEFYDTRQDILDEIQQLLSDRGSLSDKYSELFNLLLGTRDTNGVYNPVNVTDKQVQKAKEVEEEIEEIKALLKQDSPLSASVKQRLGQLIQELQSLQSNVNSEYYTNAVDNQLKAIRARVFTEHTDWDVDSVERETNIRFKNSDWYKNNHITKYRYNPETRSVVAVEEPIFMWRVTRPNDLKYIETDAPSSLWYKSIVNPKYKNDNYKPGEVTFKAVTGGIYHNSGYNNLSSNQKALLGRMKQLHSRSQEGLYQKDKLGDLIPGMRKTRGEFVDLVKLKANTIKQFFKDIKNWFTGDREAFSEEEDIYGDAYQTDAFGDPVVRESRRLFNRYARTLPLEEQSYDIMTAMASYATSSERFKVMRKYQSTVLTMEEVFNQGKSESLSSKVIRDLVDRELYGKVLEDKNDSKLLRQTNSIIGGVSSIAGFKTLGFNLLSLPQNWINGYLKIFSQLGFYHITAKDMAKAFGDTSGISKEFYLSYNQFGNKSYRVSLVDYFTGTQSTANQASELNNKGLVKYGKAWKSVSTLRDFTEFDISAVTTYAFLNKYRVPLKGSTTTIPLKDAFEQVNGVIQPKNNVDIDFNFIQQVRMNIQLANERAQGVYSPEAQPTAMKNAWFRSLMFLKKWIIPDLKTTWGTDTVHYGAGIRTIGSHQAAMRFMRDIVLLDKGNFVRTWSTSSEVQQAGLKQFAVSLGAYTVLANLIVQMSLAMDCEEDAEADWKDYVCLGLKRTTNEAEGVFTLWGMNEMKFTYISEQANGVSIFEKLGWAALGPFSVWRKFWTDDDLFTTEPYYRYKSNSNKVDWDKTHPMQAGQNGLAVLGMEFLGLRGSFIGPKSVEFQNRAFNDYAPKTYTKELRTRYKKDHEGLEIMPTRTRLAQEKKFFKKQLKEIQEEIRGYKAKGEPVPINLENKLIKLRDSYRSRVEDIKEGNIEEGSSIAYPFMDILGDRRGLDITPEPEEE